jgi:hypothetical protein
MPDIEYETVDNWETLTATIDSYFKHNIGYIFRGQADAEWKLESTLSRALRRKYPKAKNKKQQENYHLFYFRENIRGRNNLDLTNVSDNELWALGQHFGLYTPLLDWTRSPYVALYFSLLGECESGNRAIWAILMKDIDSINKENKSTNQRVEIVNPITNDNERLVNQRGLFLRIPLEEDLEDWVKKSSKDFKWVTMYKISYPDSIRNEALAALDIMNINFLSLFPDLMGSSLHTNYQFEIGPYLDDERNKEWENATEQEKLAKELIKELEEIKKNISKPSTKK